MSVYPIRDEIITARKHHFCDACKIFQGADIPESYLTPDELLIVQAARSDNWKIKPAAIEDMAKLTDAADSIKSDEC
jgi:hypothetical protein